MSMIRNCKQLQLLQLPHKLSGWICTGLWISPTWDSQLPLQFVTQKPAKTVLR